MPLPFAVLVSDAVAPCGVESFARRLARQAGPRAATSVLGAPGLSGALTEARALVLNLPVVAWKRRLLDPVRAVAAARLKGRRVVLVLHEWADLDWKRRLAYLPLVAGADTLLFSCPEVEAQFRAGVGARLHRRAGGLVPIPPNLTRPSRTVRSPAAERLADERRAGRLVIGQFGSIYPKKQPRAVLEVAAALLARGADPFVVFAGSFVEGGRDRVRADFEAHVAALGLDGRVLVTGYIETEAALFGLFEEVDAFVYSFPEGLTARRGSVYACLLSGTPVVVNAPRDPRAFDHHPAYRAALAQGQLRLVPHAAEAAAIADAVLAARSSPRGGPAPGGEEAWAAALAAVDAAVRA